MFIKETSAITFLFSDVLRYKDPRSGMWHCIPCLEH
jgi:hypothetical protein